LAGRSQGVVAASSLSPRTPETAEECKISVSLPAGGKVVVSLARTCTVDQIKTRLFALAELSGCSKDDYVLGDVSGKRFVVEFQRLTRVDPSALPIIEDGETVSLLLSLRDGVVQAPRVSLGGTPSLARRKPGVAEPSFSTPQAQRRLLSPSPRPSLVKSPREAQLAKSTLSPTFVRAPILVKSPRDSSLLKSAGLTKVLPKDDEAARMRMERDSVLKEREAALQQKRERLEAERRAEETRLEECAQQDQSRLRQSQEIARERDRQERENARLEELARRQEVEEKRRVELAEREALLQQKRELLERKQQQRSKTEEDASVKVDRKRVDDDEAGERLRELERRQRERDQMDSEVARRMRAREEAERAEKLREEELAAELRREQQLETDRLAELEQKQKARDKLAQEQEAAMYPDEEAESTLDELRRATMLDIERKKMEVEAKRAELERKMREVEERQRLLEIRRRQSEQQDREEERTLKEAAEVKAEAKRSKEATAAADRLTPRSQQSEGLNMSVDKEALWEMLREKQLAEDAKRKHLLEEKKRIDEDRHLNLVQRSKDQSLSTEDDFSPIIVDVSNSVPSVPEVEEVEEVAVPVSVHESISHESVAHESVAPPAPIVIDTAEVAMSPSLKKKKRHERTGSFGFLKKDKEKQVSMPAPPESVAERAVGASEKVKREERIVVFEG
jgi:hypothetical protein